MDGRSVRRNVAFGRPVRCCRTDLGSWLRNRWPIGARVTTNGVTNTVYLDQGGTARIVSPGGTTVTGTWAATNGQLCLNTGVASECWPYSNAFQTGVPVTLVSTCNSSSTWTANGTNPPPPMQSREGERG